MAVEQMAWGLSYFDQFVAALTVLIIIIMISISRPTQWTCLTFDPSNFRIGLYPL